jgi:hypothetical protein
VNREIEKVLFEAATEMSDRAARQEFLARTCSDDPALRQRLEKLLSLSDGATQFFGEDGRAQVRHATSTSEEASHIHVSSTGEIVAARIDRYRLIERVGEGGCGVVYLAEQEEPVHRRVALKIIRLGMDTESVIARFEAERQALALMDHPNIARVLDAGATSSGRPYFVMELVHGVRITDYCRENKLSTRARLEMFMQVCYAIQHAHQKGIIHRDIKPSNILVSAHDGAPLPKVIDFGIAKATETSPNGDTAITSNGQFIGTPAYMSPEQAGISGLDVDTRSDIYSLGVLLYELLTGCTPFDNRKLVDSGLDAMRRTLVEKEPPLPSTMVTSADCTDRNHFALPRADTQKLVSELRGDLDWIVMKALEKDRQRRYQTASALAADVQRHLKDEIVNARPPSRSHRLQKLVRRNRLLFAAIAAVTLTLLSGLGTSTWLYLRERRTSQEKEKLRQAAEFAQRHAEAREQATAAAVFLARNDFEHADQLVSQIAAGMMPASLETVSLLRSVGTWRALHGEWRQGANHYVTLQRLIVPAESTDASRAGADLMPAAALLMECGDVEGYDRTRRAAIERFGKSAKEGVAERVLKSCLLAPTDESMLRDLAPLHAVATNWIATPAPEPMLAAWQVVAIGLYEYRRGNSAEALAWCRRYSTFSHYNPSRSALARCVMALALHNLGETERVQTELARARELIGPRFDRALQVGDWNEGYWHDWLIARIMLREASALASPPVNPAR